MHFCSPDYPAEKWRNKYTYRGEQELDGEQACVLPVGQPHHLTPQHHHGQGEGERGHRVSDYVWAMEKVKVMETILCHGHGQDQG